MIIGNNLRDDAANANISSILSITPAGTPSGTEGDPLDIATPGSVPGVASTTSGGSTTWLLTGVGLVLGAGVLVLVVSNKKPKMRKKTRRSSRQYSYSY